jgi:hypothetical protein
MTCVESPRLRSIDGMLRRRLLTAALALPTLARGAEAEKLRIGPWPS